MWIVVDNAFALNESAGLELGARIGGPPLGSLKPEHIGEIVFLGSIASVITLGGSLMWRYRPVREHRTLLAGAAGLVALAVLGGAVDILNSPRSLLTFNESEPPSSGAEVQLISQ